MKWRGRRQSTNVEDKRSETAADTMIRELIANSGPYTGGAPPVSSNDKKSKPKVDYTPKDIKVAKELGRLNREHKTPVPTPRPLNIIKTQVTPGKWRTNDK